MGMNFQLERSRSQAAEDLRFIRPGEGMPLRAGATACEQDKRVTFIRLFRVRSWQIEDEFGFAVRMKKCAVAKEASFRGWLRAGPVFRGALSDGRRRNGS